VLAHRLHMHWHGPAIKHDPLILYVKNLSIHLVPTFVDTASNFNRAAVMVYDLAQEICYLIGNDAP